MIMVIWMVWIIHQFMTLIMILNFLIAIISQSYENVMSKSQILKYKTRVDLNLECLQVIDFLVKLERFESLLIVSQNEDHLENGEWEGVVNSIKLYIRQSMKNLKKAFTRQSQATEEKMATKKETNQKIEATKQEINEKIEATKQEIIESTN